MTSYIDVVTLVWVCVYLYIQRCLCVRLYLQQCKNCFCMGDESRANKMHRWKLPLATTRHWLPLGEGLITFTSDKSCSLHSQGSLVITENIQRWKKGRNNLSSREAFTIFCLFMVFNVKIECGCTNASYRRKISKNLW